MGTQDNTNGRYQALSVPELEALVRELEAKEEALEAKIVNMLAVYPWSDDATEEFIKIAPNTL